MGERPNADGSKRAPLRVALVGCGQIADAHLSELRKVPGATVVGLCDRDLDLAQQASLRFGGAPCFGDLETMLAAAKPEVLHVTTPPASHSAIARQALAAGVHVYVEKPLTLDAAEAAVLLAEAEARGRLVCVGHDQLFEPAWLRTRQLVARGALGRIVHADSLLCYDLDGPYGRELALDPGHWVHRLPGGLFQNTVSHALYKITDVLEDEDPEVEACWFSLAEPPAFPTELRVTLRGSRTTASLVFTSAVRPLQRRVRLLGTRGAVDVEFDGRIVRRCLVPGTRGPFVKLELPARNALEELRSFALNLRAFARGDIHYFSGMGELFSRFYAAVRGEAEHPIPHRETLRVTRLLDRIFERCRERAGRTPLSAASAREMVSAR